MLTLLVRLPRPLTVIPVRVSRMLLVGGHRARTGGKATSKLPAGSCPDMVNSGGRRTSTGADIEPARKPEQRGKRQCPASRWTSPPFAESCQLVGDPRHGETSFRRAN